MGANEDLGLPRDKMKKIVIAFDIDGTLRCNCTDTCRDPNYNIIALAAILDTMKNTHLIAWSGGGAKYAQNFIDSNEQLRHIFKQRCFTKIGYNSMYGQPDIAIDDIQDTALGKINLIVREK